MSDVQTWPRLIVSRGQSLSLKFARLLTLCDGLRSWVKMRHQPKENKQTNKKTHKSFSLMSICLDYSPRIWNKKGTWGPSPLHCKLPELWHSGSTLVPGSNWWEGSQTSVAGGGKGNGQGGSAVQRQLQGNRPNVFTSHVRPTLGSLKSIARGGWVGYLRSTWEQ